MLGSHIMVTKAIPVSLAFSNLKEELAVSTLPKIAVTLRGTRKMLAKLYQNPPVMLLDAADFTTGQVHIQPYSQLIFLPPQVSMVDYNLDDICLTVISKIC